MAALGFGYRRHMINLRDMHKFMAQPSAPILDLCVVVPAFNEAENLGPLAAEIDAVLKDFTYEMIFVDDGSTDNSVQKLQDLKQHYPTLRALSHRVNAGQSRGLHSGIIAARAPIIATLDSDGQNDPADIPRLYQALMRGEAADNLAMIGGQRQNRQDSWSKKWASRKTKYVI